MGRKLPVGRLAWAAGVVETRGKIRRVDNPMRKSAQVILQVRTRHLDIVTRLCELTGSTPQWYEPKTIEDKNRRGCAEHCPEPHIHIAPYLPATGTWAVTGAGAVIVLHNLLPYLCTTTGMQTFMDEVVDGLPDTGRGRYAIELSVARLRRLGWAIPAELEARGAP